MDSKDIVEIAKGSESFILKLLKSEGLFGTITLLLFLIIFIVAVVWAIKYGGKIIDGLVHSKANKQKKINEEKDRELREQEIKNYKETLKQNGELISEMKKTLGISIQKVYYNAKYDAVVQVWIGNVEENEFEKSIATTIELMKNHGAKYIISDTLLSAKMQENSLIWLITSVDCQLKELGLETLFFIVSPKTATAQGVESYKEKSELNIEIYKSLADVIKQIESKR
jgi:hypothetical protein